MREHAAQLEAGQFGDAPRAVQRLLGWHAHAVIARVHLQTHVETEARVGEHRAQRGRARDAVDAHGQARALVQRQQASALVGTDHGIGHEQVVEAGRGEGLGLRHFGHGQPARPGQKLQAGDVGALVRLGVRAQAHAGAARGRGHARDVALEHLEVHQDRGRLELVECPRRSQPLARPASGEGPWWKPATRQVETKAAVGRSVRSSCSGVTATRLSR